MLPVEDGCLGTPMKQETPTARQGSPYSSHEGEWGTHVTVVRTEGRAMTTDAADSGETNPTTAADVTGQPDESAENPTAPLEPKDLDRYECRSCGYVYEPVKGDGRAVEPGTPFEDLSIVWRCPVCSARASQFSNIGPTGNPSGFKENLGYGLGVNRLTPGQKNILIFSALGIGVLFFLSLYGLK